MEGAVSLVWLALFAVAFWLLLIRPQRRRQRQTMELQRSLKVGDEVMLGSGVFARVSGEVDDPVAGDCLLVEVSPGVEMKIARGAVMRVLTPREADEASAASGSADPADPAHPEGRPADADGER